MHADNDPVGVFEILDGCSFAQEFRVGNDGDIGVRPCLRDEARDLIAGSYGNS